MGYYRSEGGPDLAPNGVKIGVKYDPKRVEFDPFWTTFGPLLSHFGAHIPDICPYPYVPIYPGIWTPQMEGPQITGFGPKPWISPNPGKSWKSRDFVKSRDFRDFVKSRDFMKSDDLRNHGSKNPDIRNPRSQIHDSGYHEISGIPGNRVYCLATPSVPSESN